MKVIRKEARKISNEENISNTMRKLTKEMLKNAEDTYLTPEEAIFNEEIDKKKKNILVLGLNPAGNEQDVKREKDCKIFLNYVKYKKQGKEYELKGKLVNNGYFKPIYNLVNEVYKNDKNDEDKANFSWQNRNFDDVKKEIETEETEGNIDILEEHFGELKRDYTILIGDLFYYHETSSRDFIKKINDKDKKFREKVEKMLKLHINKVQSKGKTLDFILINNARASEYIIDAITGKDEDKHITCYNYPNNNEKGIPIFFSGMLSNGGESNYGRKRLIKEIREKIKKRK